VLLFVQMIPDDTLPGFPIWVDAFEHIPEIESLIVEVPSPDGPFGAKGIGEANVLSAPAAVANAIAAAGGPRMRELPMTAPRIWRAMHEANGSG